MQVIRVIIAAASPIRVLVVDDSAVVRQVAGAILTQENMSVSVAADPIIAMDKMARERPDVIVLDLEMPRMHGMTFLRKIMSEDPIPVVVCSGTAESGGAIAALEEGAVAVIAKPKLGVRDFLHESAVMLIDTVVSASQAKLRRKRAVVATPRLSRPAPPKHAIAHVQRCDSLIAIGASTGGPEAISSILEQLDPDCPPVVIVQHMPEGFTAAYANRLDGICRIRVKEGQHGDELFPGMAVIAPGNRHMTVRRTTRRYRVEIDDGALVNRHRPSVDVLFSSVSAEAGRSALGILLTGMGTDGAAGLLAMHQAGATTLAQDEASSVVFGMPREAIFLGAADSVVALRQIPQAVARWAKRNQSGCVTHG